jgi:hypothetical protein
VYRNKLHVAVSINLYQILPNPHQLVHALTSTCTNFDQSASTCQNKLMRQLYERTFLWQNAAPFLFYSSICDQN